MTSVIWFTLFLVTSFQLIEGQDNAHTRIPDYLLPCYQNQTLHHPENRPPMTIRTLIELIRKVENYEGNNIEMVALATSMLHRFRLDGITRTPDVQEAPGVIPWGVNGPQFFKHRLVLKHMIPQNNYAFPNASLTDTELCTLHFMLSSSLDDTERGDESTVCSRLSNYQMSRGRKPRYLRFRRDINEKTDLKQMKKLESEDGSDDSNTKESTEPQIKATDSIVSTSQLINAQNFTTQSAILMSTKGRPLIVEPATESSNNNTLEESENVDVFNDNALNKEGNKGNFIFDDDTISPRIAPVRAKTSQTTVSPPRRAADGQRKIGGQGTDYRGSSCPIENGVIWTKWGAISAGPLLAGIATGVYKQSIKISDLIRGGARASKLPYDLRESTVDNRYAATLVGDLAEVTLIGGPKNTINVGTDGGWNSTLFPRWYFIRTPTNTEMTDAEIRGALDGLIMSKNIQQWEARVPAGSLKLSQLLESYYSEMGVFEPKYRACYRKELYTEVAPSADLKEQTYRFAEVLDEHMISGASIESDTIRAFGNTAVERLTSYIPSLGFSCPNKPLRDAEASNTRVFVNLTVVIDCSWDYNYIQSFIQKLMEDIDVRPYGSKMTVVDGKSFKPFFVDANSSLHIDQFTYSEYSQRERGIDIPFALEQGIRDSMKAVLDMEKEQGTSTGISQVILFIPQTPITLSDEELIIAKDGLQYFKEYLPDVNFLYASPGNKDNYQYLVINSNTDVINIEYGEAETSLPLYVENVVKRLRKVHVRSTNPVCGSQWVGDPRKAQTTYFLQRDGIQHLRIHPNYFYSSESVIIKVQGYGYGTLQVCNSTKVEYPAANLTSDVQCKDISNNAAMEIAMTNPCKGYKYISQCPPLYISVTATAPTLRCTDRECPFADFVKYSIEHEGTGCTAGVRGLLGSTTLVTITLGLLILVKYSVSLNC